MRVLIAPDKFKGTLGAAAVASAMKRGWQNVRPNDLIDVLPMSDGGDGFGELLGRALKAKLHSVKTVNAAGHPVKASIFQAEKTVIIEGASSNGLALLPPGKFHPFDLDTAGVAVFLRAAESLGPQTCFVGVGGSSTNDGGFGMAQALGYGFFDRRNKQIVKWLDLSRLHRITAPEEPLKLPITLAVDVQNPLLGPEGCTRVYGPQKGLRPGEFAKAEKALQRLAEVSAATFKKDFSVVPGAGAAGGLGFGLLCFAGAKPASGFEVFSKYSGLSKKVRDADLVLTGEGSLDSQSLMGKGLGELAALCRKHKKQCIGIAGKVEAHASTAFHDTVGLLDLTGIEEARSSTAKWISKAAALAAQRFTKRNSG